MAPKSTKSTSQLVTVKRMAVSRAVEKCDNAGGKPSAPYASVVAKQDSEKHTHRERKDETTFAASQKPCCSIYFTGVSKSTEY